MANEAQRDEFLMLSGVAYGFAEITGNPAYAERGRQYFNAAMALEPVSAEIEALTDEKLLAELFA
jgi:hypothetical protein